MGRDGLFATLRGVGSLRIGRRGRDLSGLCQRRARDLGE